MARQLQRAVQNALLPVPAATPVGGKQSRGDDHAGGAGSNAQVNDPSLDHVTTFTQVNTRPFEFSTESETSIVSKGRDITVAYNSDANSVVQFFPGFGLFFTQLYFSGYSTSHDGGRTWTSGFAPSASPDSPFTFGDPSLAMDRRGNIYYASLGTDAVGNSSVNVNKSADRGSTFGTATVVVRDDGADKEWLAVGPDPAAPWRDNLYVTWTSFTNTGSSELHLARSTDGGATWTAQLLFAPVDDGIHSSFIQFSNPVVDAATGRLYIPFLHFSDIDADDVRVLVSDDAGKSFRFLAFNVPGAPDAFAYPVVTPGRLNDCGTGGIRNALVQGTNNGPGRFGSFRYTQATRLITQPAAAAFRGRLVIALNSSTSPFFADPSAGSEIDVLYSSDGGTTWAPPLVVAASTAADLQHVHPAISLSQNGNTARVGYYVQQANGQLRTDVATLHIDGNHLRLARTAGLSTTAFDLTPSNIPFPSATNPFQTTNYDRTIAHCYDIGEYMSLASGDEGAVAAWGDNRNSWTGPAGSAAPYTHAQPDVFFGRVDDN